MKVKVSLTFCATKHGEREYEGGRGIGKHMGGVDIGGCIVGVGCGLTWTGGFKDLGGSLLNGLIQVTGQ